MKDNQWVAYLEEQGLSKRSIRTYTDAIDYCRSWCEEQGIEMEMASYRELLSYIQEMRQRENKAVTIQRTVINLKHYYRYLIQRDIRVDNPAQGIKIQGIQRRRLYHILSKQDLEGLYHKYEVAQGSETANRNRILLGLLIWQGLRTIDLHKLNVEDVNLRKATIYISSTRKSNERTLHLASQQILDLMEYIHEVRPNLLRKCKKEPDRLLVTRHGNAIQMYRVIQSITALHPQLKNLNQIRASVITHWLKNYNLRQVQYMAGHRYVSSTEAYLVNDLEDLKENVEKYHPLI